MNGFCVSQERLKDNLRVTIAGLEERKEGKEKPETVKTTPLLIVELVELVFSKKIQFINLLINNSSGSWPISKKRSEFLEFHQKVFTSK